MSKNIFKLNKKIPTSTVLGKKFTASDVNTVLAVVRHAIINFKNDEQSIKYAAFTWLESINFTLKSWNEARNAIGLVSPRSRTKINSAMEDVVANYDCSNIYLIHPDDLSQISGLSSAVMTLNLTATSSSENKSETKSAAPKTKKVSYSNALKQPSKPKSGPIKGTNNLKIGVPPKHLFLHLKLLAGGNIEPLQKLLTSKKSISDVKFIKLTETSKFTTFQISLKVEVSNLDFWRRDTFWPTGAIVNIWKGSTQTDREFYSKRIQISGIKGGTTTSSIKNYFRRIYPSINFSEISCDEIIRATTVLSVIMNSRNFKNFMAAGLQAKQWPMGVGIKFLKKNLIESRNSSWEIEVARENEFEQIMDQTVEKLSLPEESNSNTIEFNQPEFKIDKDYMAHMMSTFREFMNSKYDYWYHDFSKRSEMENYDYLRAFDYYFWERKNRYDHDGKMFDVENKFEKNSTD